MVQPRVDVLQTYDASCLSCHQGPVAHTQSPVDLKFELALDCLLAFKIALDCLLTLNLHWIVFMFSKSEFDHKHTSTSIAIGANLIIVIFVSLFSSCLKTKHWRYKTLEHQILEISHFQLILNHHAYVLVYNVDS